VCESLPSERAKLYLAMLGSCFVSCKNGLLQKATRSFRVARFSSWSPKDQAQSDLQAQLRNAVSAGSRNGGFGFRLNQGDDGQDNKLDTLLTKQWSRRRRKLNVPRAADDSDSSVLLFPGQGAQFVGMGAGLLDVPLVREMYDRASQILDYDLLKVILFLVSFHVITFSLT